MLFVVTDHPARKCASEYQLVKESNVHNLTCFALDGSGKFKSRRVTVEERSFDVAPTLPELLEVKHNGKFIFGESLLGKPGRRRPQDQYEKSIQQYGAYTHKIYLQKKNLRPCRLFSMLSR